MAEKFSNHMTRADKERAIYYGRRDAASDRPPYRYIDPDMDKAYMDAYTGQLHEDIQTLEEESRA